MVLAPKMSANRNNDNYTFYTIFSIFINILGGIIFTSTEINTETSI